MNVVVDRVCGRPMKKGGDCTRTKLITGFFTPQEFQWPSCYNHQTPEERKQYLQVRRTEEAEDERCFQQARPACWSWPVPEDHATWEPVFDVGSGDHQYTQETADGMLASCRRDPQYRAGMLLDHWQDGRCALCGDRGVHLVQDHDHATGLVRGLLCRSCNTREGCDRRPGGLFGRYRQRPPTTMLNVRIVYWDPFTQEFAEPAAPRSEADLDVLLEIPVYRPEEEHA